MQAARSEIQSTLGSLQLLKNLVIKQEVSELADSVRESCKYRKGKVTAMLAELQNTSNTLTGTSLAPENGEVYQELMNLNEELHASIVGYTAMREKVLAQEQQSLASSSGAAAAATTMLHHSGEDLAAADNTAAQQVATPGSSTVRRTPLASSSIKP